jgi:hypothetical protein
MAIRTNVVGVAGTATTDRQVYALSKDGSVTTTAGPLNAIATQCQGPIEGWARPDRYYAICPGEGTVTTFDLSGRVVATVDLSVASGPEPITGSFVDASGRLFTWNPFARSMTAVDTTSGRVLFSGSPGGAAAAPAADPIADLVRRIGDWLAPPAAAKIWLSPALLASPDGTRIYALGVTGDITTRTGSAGIDVFDTRSLSFVAHWEPTADWFSMALSTDGSQLYVAGMAGVDWTGAPRSAEQSGSLTVLDVSSGEVRAIFGQLGPTVDLGVATQP